MIAALALAAAASSALSFGVYVPPHAAADGVRYRVEATASVDVDQAMKACGIDDFAHLSTHADERTYQFAVTRSTEDKANCIRNRLPRTARIEPSGNWIIDAQTD